MAIDKLDTVRKLIALTASSVEGEAAAAALNACRIIREQGFEVVAAVAAPDADGWHSVYRPWTRDGGQAPRSGLDRCAVCGMIRLFDMCECTFAQAPQPRPRPSESAYRCNVCGAQKLGMYIECMACASAKPPPPDPVTEAKRKHRSQQSRRQRAYGEPRQVEVVLEGTPCCCFCDQPIKKADWVRVGQKMGSVEQTLIHDSPCWERL